MIRKKIKSNINLKTGKSLNLRLNHILKGFSYEYIYFVARYLDLYIFDIIGYKSKEEEELFNVFVKEVGVLPYEEEGYLNFIKYLKTFLYPEFENDREEILPSISKVFISKKLKDYIKGKISQTEKELSIEVDNKQFQQFSYRKSLIAKKNILYKFIDEVINGNKDLSITDMWIDELKTMLEHNFTDIDDFREIKSSDLLKDLLSVDLEPTAGIIKVELEVKELKDKIIYKSIANNKEYEALKTPKSLYLSGIGLVKQEKFNWQKKYPIDRMFRIYKNRIIPDIASYILFTVISKKDTQKDTENLDKGFVLRKSDIISIIRKNYTNHFKAYLEIYRYIFENIGMSILSLPIDLIFEMYSFIPEIHMNALIRR